MKRLLFVFVLAIFLPVVLLAQQNPPTTPPTLEQTSADFKSAFSRFKSISDELKKIQTELKNARKEKQIELQKNLLPRKKDHLTKAVEVFIAHAENIKKRVELNKVIYGDLESSIITEINDDIAKLNEFKTKIANAQTLDELNQLARDLRAQRKDIYQLKIRRLLLLSHIGHFEKAIIVNAEQRSKRIAEKITALKNAGKDTTQLESWLNQANTKIQEAKTALATLKNSVNSQELNELQMDGIRKKLNEIKDTIKVVYDLFRQIAITGNSL